MQTDADEYRFLTLPNASLTARVDRDERLRPEIRILANRAGVLSLANVLFWLESNSWRREFLALVDLPFAAIEAPLSIVLRLADSPAAALHGEVSCIDQGDQFEWSCNDDELQRLALAVHRLASRPEHEYEHLMPPESAVGVHLRMMDAATWMDSGT